MILFFENALIEALRKSYASDELDQYIGQMQKSFPLISLAPYEDRTVIGSPIAIKLAKIISIPAESLAESVCENLVSLSPSTDAWNYFIGGGVYINAEPSRSWIGEYVASEKDRTDSFLSRLPSNGALCVNELKKRCEELLQLRGLSVGVQDCVRHCENAFEELTLLFEICGNEEFDPEFLRWKSSANILWRFKEFSLLLDTTDRYSRVISPERSGERLLQLLFTSIEKFLMSLELNLLEAVRRKRPEIYYMSFRNVLEAFWNAWADPGARMYLSRELSAESNCHLRTTLRQCHKEYASFIEKVFKKP